MSQFLPNSPTAGGGPVSLEALMVKLHQTHLDTYGHFLTMLPQWRAHGAITEAVYQLMDKRLCQLFEFHRMQAEAYGAKIPSPSR